MSIKNRVIDINCLALSHKLRAVYWCSSTDDLAYLDTCARKHGLMISTKFPRLIYNPLMTTDAEVNDAFTKHDRVRVGIYLGYPTPGDDWDDWWISWQYRDKKNVFRDLFNFQMKRLDTNALIEMKERWNATIPTYYFDFEIRYRANHSWDDKKYS